MDALVRGASRGGGLVCNIGTGTETSVNELYATMARLSGVDQPPVHGPPREGDVFRSCLDPERAMIQLGWRPWTDLEAGTGAVLRYFAEPQA